MSDSARSARAREPSSVYAFADDFIDEGVSRVADLLAAQGFGGASLATLYFYHYGSMPLAGLAAASQALATARDSARTGL